MDALDASDNEGVVGLGDGARQINRAAGIFDDEALEAESRTVDGGVADTEVIGKSAEEEPLEAALAEISSEAGRGEVVVFEERGVRVDVAAEAFAQDEFGVWNVDGWMKGCAGGILQAVFGPESLRTIRSLDGLEGLLMMRGGKRDVLGGMPVLGEDDVLELLRERVDRWDDLIAFGYGEVAAGAKVVLHVDDEQGIIGLGCDHHGRLIVPLEASADEFGQSDTLSCYAGEFRGRCDDRDLEVE